MKHLRIKNSRTARNSRINNTSSMQRTNHFFLWNGEFVTVEYDDGQVYIGTLHCIDGDSLVVRTGVPGRSRRLFVDHIDEVLPVNARNPHIDNRTLAGEGARP